MKRAVLAAEGEFRVDEVAPSAPMEGEALVVPKIVGVCGSDLHVYEGTHPKVRPPVVLGHECAGTVQDASSDGEFQPGDRVTFSPLVGCGHCVHCIQGRPNVCLNRQVVGFQRPGGLAGLVRVPETNLVRLPDSVSSQLGALCEPLAVAVHVVSLARSAISDDVIVTGAGPIGLLVGLYAREHRGVEVRIVEVDENRRAFAESLGFKTASDVAELSSRYATEAAYRAQSPTIFECTGSPALFEQLLALVPAPAQIVLIGTFESGAMTALQPLVRAETSIVGSQMYTVKDFEAAMSSMATEKSANLYSKLLSESVYSLDAVGAAFEEARNPALGAKVQIEI